MRKLNEIIFLFQDSSILYFVRLFHYFIAGVDRNNILRYIFSEIKQNLHLLKKKKKKKTTIFEFVKIIKNLTTVFRICL